MGSFDVSASCVYVFMYVNERIFFLSRPPYTAYRALSLWVDVKGLSVPVCACARYLPCGLVWPLPPEALCICTYHAHI